MKPIAIIPARGGSKRLPRKNIKPLFGRPVLAYTIEAAFHSKVIDRVIVSTEDAEIKQVALECGAEVMPRSELLAGDRARMYDVCVDVLQQVEEQSGDMPQHFCCLLPTAALRTGDDIRNAYGVLQPGECDFVIAIREYSENPFQALVKDDEDHLKLMWPDLANTPRWEAPEVVVDSGSLYWCDSRMFIDEGDFYGSTLRGYKLPRHRAIDVDTADDWDLLEYYFERSRT